jgi:adenylate kinase
MAGNVREPAHQRGRRRTDIIRIMDTQITKITSWLGAGSIDIFGRPFSGKDTQARELVELFNGRLISGGDILRSHHDPERIEQIMAQGGIIPSDFYLDMVLPYLSQPNLKDKPLILSAVGRAHGEEAAIIQATNESGHPLKAVILLKLSEDEVWQRFELSKIEHDRGERQDDKAEVLRLRLQKFQDRTAPAIEYYREMGLLIEVDGASPREQVTEAILRGLAQRAAA